MEMLINDVPVSCINQAAVAYHVPATLILAIMRKENGRNGQAVRNNNGTHDLGIMQINTRWLPTLAKYGYTKQDLQFNACKNVMVGTWILAGSLANGKTAWSGVGNYHSKTPKFNLRYRTDIETHYQTITQTFEQTP